MTGAKVTVAVTVKPAKRGFSVDCHGETAGHIAAEIGGAVRLATVAGLRETLAAAATGTSPCRGTVRVDCRVEATPSPGVHARCELVGAHLLTIDDAAAVVAATSDWLGVT